MDNDLYKAILYPDKVIRTFKTASGHPVQLHDSLGPDPKWRIIGHYQIGDHWCVGQWNDLFDHISGNKALKLIPQKKYWTGYVYINRKGQIDITGWDPSTDKDILGYTKVTVFEK